jgi:hypothetical protein
MFDHSIQSHLRLGCLLACLVAAAGCGDGSTLRRGSVKGQVLVDGVALDEGTISFAPTDGNSGPSAGTTVKNGSFELAADKGPVVGMSSVAIVGGRRTGKQVPNPMYPDQVMDEVVPIVPQNYNASTTLKREIKPGANTLDFDLTSK